jgi:NAD(P)-dependent dehydrogenase (short-subunit alcohol dehydrogenase family)
MARGINSRLADAGYHLILTDREQSLVDEAADAIHNTGGSADSYVVDVTSQESVDSLMSAIEETGRAVDGLVNAAGILDRKFLFDLDADAYNAVLQVNLVGPFRMIRAAAQQMLDQRWGRIINISSIAGTVGYVFPSYASSKAGLSNLTRSLVVDFWGTGVTVNAICPGVVDTPMAAQAVRDRLPEKVPSETIVDPEEIGQMCVYLMSDDAKNVNGANLVIDGGATAQFLLFEPPRPALRHASTS